jgi:fructokinase
MTTIYAIGETVYDIIFEKGQPKAARAGGSMLNTAVSLGRCGLKVEMITELGEDQVGNLVMDFLRQNGVSTSFIRPYKDFKTPVSLAFLDEHGDAHYSFYKNYPEKRLDIQWPAAVRGDFVLFGSYYSLDKAIREKIISYVQKAKHDGGLIYYDPNIRKNHMAEIRKLLGEVMENFALADIVRGSDEDFQNLFGLDDNEQIYKTVREAGCDCLIITRGRLGAELLFRDTRLHIPAGDVEIKSTIGAGDAFNAGIICGIVRKGYYVDDLVNIKEQQWAEIMGLGITFASDVCRSFDNYIAIELAKIYK